MGVLTPPITAAPSKSVPAGNGTYFLALVLYFPDERAARRSAQHLDAALAPLEGTIVPFTAPVPGRRLVSRGVDPDPLATIGFRGGCSWRQFIVNRIAWTVASATAEEPEGLVVEALLHRLRLDGIEPCG